LNAGFSKTPGIESFALVVATQDGKPDSAVGTALANHFKSDSVKISTTFFKPEFVSDNLFASVFDGSTEILTKLELANTLDALLLARETIQYTKNSDSLDNVLTANVQLQVQVVPIAGNIQNQSWTFTANGAGFICSEPYTQEKSVVDQCLELVKPLAISPEQANFVRSLIDEETHKDGQSLETANAEINEKVSLVQKKLNKLTRAFLDELIDEESYQAAKADLVLEKTTLKEEKQRLHRTRSSFWNEPAKEVVNAMELAGKSLSDKSPQEISQVVHKVGTNRLLSRKTVTFSFAEPYDFIPSLLASRHVATPNPSPSLCDENLQSPVWCARAEANQFHNSRSCDLRQSLNST
jgi:hypothetical protein